VNYSAVAIDLVILLIVCLYLFLGPDLRAVIERRPRLTSAVWEYGPFLLVMFVWILQISGLSSDRTSSHLPSLVRSVLLLVAICGVAILAYLIKFTYIVYGASSDLLLKTFRSAFESLRLDYEYTGNGFLVPSKNCKITFETKLDYRAPVVIISVKPFSEQDLLVSIVEKVNLALTESNIMMSTREYLSFRSSYLFSLTLGLFGLFARVGTDIYLLVIGR
jgi:hypothetical protein